MIHNYNNIVFTYVFLSPVKPAPPNITLGRQEPLQIEWCSFCVELHLSMGTCEVRNRVEGNQVWLEVSFLKILICILSSSLSLTIVITIKCMLKIFSPFTQHEGGYHPPYILESPLPDTFYEFQVRCNCSEGLISDWSTSHRIRSVEKGESLCLCAE